MEDDASTSAPGETSIFAGDTKRKEESLSVSSTTTTTPAISKSRREQEFEQRLRLHLSKPSLRKRLEAYYSLMAPEQIDNRTGQWFKKLDLIYSKYGGTVELENKLCNKLVRKYGDAVRFLTAENAVSASYVGGGGGAGVGRKPTSDVQETGKQETKMNPTALSVAAGTASGTVVTSSAMKPEEWFELKKQEKKSGIVDFTSNCFDPEAALLLRNDEIPPNCIPDAPLLDNISKARFILPSYDPQRLEKRKIADSKNTKCVKQQQHSERLSALQIIASKYENYGPLSVLFNCMTYKHRIRVMIRYVDRIRGTLTGYVLGFDKHWNMLLRDVDELYSPRIAMGQSALSHDFNGDWGDDGRRPQWDSSNAEVELERRLGQPIETIKSGPGSTAGAPATEGTNSNQASDVATIQRHFKPPKRRYLRQLLVRGDNVVMVWRANDESSSTKEGRLIGTPGNVAATSILPAITRNAGAGSGAKHKRGREMTKGCNW